MKIILASKSGVRKKILDTNQVDCEVCPSNVDEDEVKISLISSGANPLSISKNLAELKANKVSLKNPDRIVLGADSVIDFNGKLISKPKNREEALNILIQLNGKEHKLISSVCISKNGSMIWNFTDTSSLMMKKLSLNEIKKYLSNVGDKELFAYGVYQIESGGRNLFSSIVGNEDSIMGLPIQQIKEYIKNLK